MDENTVDGMGEPVWGGLAYAIPSTAIVIGGNTPTDLFYDGSPSIDSGLSNFIVHEMGHCLGLYHVFEGQDVCYGIPFPGPTCPENYINGTTNTNGDI